MIERSNAAKFKGQPLTLLGPKLKAGDKAPAFRLVARDLSDFVSKNLQGKTFVLSVVPSLDTGVCAIQTRRFEAEAVGLAKDITILTVSLDLPFAQKRFCETEGISRVVTASDHKYREFGEAYGVLIKELGLLNRAVFVVDRKGVIAHAQYVEENTNEPDYAPALEALKRLV
jgi:thioredoxin-dependent peroxiredoxin